MNQILSIDNTKKSKIKNNNKQPVKTTSIVMFFAIALIIFGVFMIGSGSYSMYKDSVTGASSKATITSYESGERKVTIKVENRKAISKLIYNWNGEDTIEIDCNGKKTVEEVIDMPTGTNTLNITVIDVNGQESKDQRTYTIQGDIDIELEVVGNNIKVTAEGKEELSYMTYRWDEEEEQRVDINDITIEQSIEIPKGLHTLTVIVVDVNNKSETKEQEIQGVTKPKLEVTTDGSDNFVINASDEQGLKKVEFIINENERYMLNLEGRTELEYAYPLHDGENKLEVRVYNMDDISEISKVKLTK